MINKVYTAYISKINSITPKIDTVYENKEYTPINGKPYQEIYIMPSDNIAPYMNETSYNMEGLIQITLCYPLNEGRTSAMDRASLYMNLFPFADNFTSDGLTVRQAGMPKITNLGINDNRYKIVLRVGFVAVIE